MYENNEIPKYKKKKNNSSLSKKRSDHKHDYEKVIIENFLGNYVWEYRSKICGRFKSENFTNREKGLLKETFDGKMNRVVYRSLSIPEIHIKYPDVRVFVTEKTADGKIDFGILIYIEVVFTKEDN